MNFKTVDGKSFNVLTWFCGDFLHVDSQPQHKLSYDFCQLCGLGVGCCRRDQFPPAGFLEGACSVDTLCKQSSEEKFLLLLPVLQGILVPAICSVLSSMMHSKPSHPSSSSGSAEATGVGMVPAGGLRFGPAKSSQSYLFRLSELLPNVSIG